MKAITMLLAAGVVLGSPRSHAAILDFRQIIIDFTKPEDATAKATWSEPDRITVSPEGLGWDGESAASRNGWIQTKPVALGRSWRTTSVISARVTIQPAPHEFTLSNGQKMTADDGDVYVRYSPDLKHWSSWQVLQRAEPQSIEEKKRPGRYYSGIIRVPYRERTEYGNLVSDYSGMDVPWKSDEEAAVRWILNRDPEFFSKHLPFIGYVEFLYEGGFRGGQRLESFKADISYGMGGLHSPPRDPAVYKDRDVPWRFKADDDVKPKP